MLDVFSKDTVRLPDFKAALENWTRHALPILANTQPLIVDSYRWVDTQPGVRTRVSAPGVSWVHFDSTKVGTEWIRLTTSIENDLRVSSQINRLVGADGMPHLRVDQDGICRFIVSPFTPRAIEGELTYPPFDKTTFDRQYARLEHFIISNTLQYVTSILLVGIDFGSQIVELGTDFTIERLTDEEMWNLGSQGFIQSMPGGSDDYGMPGLPRHVLRLRQTLLKRLDSHDSAASACAAAALQERIAEARMRLASSVSLVRQSQLRFGGVFTACLTYSLGTLFNLDSYERSWRQSELTEDELSEVQSFWKLIDVTGNLHGSLQTGLRRLAYASERLRAEDKILDAMIAAEAILLTDTEKTELRYRFALRGSWYLHDETGIARRREFDFLKDAYDVRSVIAHGNLPKSRDLKIKGTSVTLDSFASHLESRIREILRRALLRGRDRDVLPKMWDDDLIGPRPTPS